MSKKARIQRLRAERIAAERAQAARELRGRRLKRLGAVVLSAAVMVAGAAVVSAAEDERLAAPAGETSALLAGLTERAGVLGDPKAPLTVTEYLDFQCPVCAVAARKTVPVILRDYVRTGKVRLAPCTSSARTRWRPHAWPPGPSDSVACGRSSRRSTPARKRRTRATSPAISCARSP